MSTERFNAQKYSDLKRRVEALEQRIRLDSGNEQEVSKRLLPKLKKKLRDYEMKFGIPEELKQQSAPKSRNVTSSYEFWKNVEQQTTTANTGYQNAWSPNPNFKWNVNFVDDKKYREDTRTESEMVDDLGVLYAIFGSTYQTMVNYHQFKVRFKKQTKRQEAFYRVYADVYEDDIRICKDVVIGFWPFHFGDTRCGDMEFSTYEPGAIEKYHNGCTSVYLNILEGLKNIWNEYMDNQISVPMLGAPIAGYLAGEVPSPNNGGLQKQLTREEREDVIQRVERLIINGEVAEFRAVAKREEMMAYKSFSTLKDFLEMSGVVYKVQSDGVYLWNYKTNEYEQFIDYYYDRSRARYTLFLF